MPLGTDPFSRCYAAIWDALEALPAWSAAVLVGNRVDLTTPGSATQRAVHRRSALPGDKRSVAELDMTAFGFIPAANSRVVGVSQTFTLYLSDEVTRLANLNDVKWNTLKALYQKSETLGLDDLNARWRIANGRDETTMSDQQRMNGYQAVADITIEMMIPRHVLLA